MKAVAGFSGAPGDRQPATLESLPDPRPGAGEVLVEVRASALNQADLLQLRGLYPPPPGESPVPGLECAGVVLERGSGVDSVEEGDRVMALLGGGGHGSRVVAPAAQVLPIPAGLSFEEAAAIPEAGITAWTNLVYEGRLHRGQTVLITAATSSVGIFAVQLAREIGAEIWVAGRSLERLEWLRELGARTTVELGEELPARVLEATGGRGVDLVLEMAAGRYLGSHLAALKERGRLVLVGLMAGPAATLDLGLVLRRRLVIRGSVLRGRSLEEKAGLVAGFAADVGEALERQRIVPVIDRVVPFSEVEAAYAALERGGLHGKVVISFGPDS